MSSVEGLASQVCSFLCVFMMFNMARGRAYTLPFMIATLVLCLLSTSQMAAIGHTAVEMVKK